MSNHLVKTCLAACGGHHRKPECGPQVCRCCPSQPPKAHLCVHFAAMSCLFNMLCFLQPAGSSGQGSAASHLPCEVVQLHLEVAAVNEDAQPLVSVRLTVLPAPAEQSVQQGQETQTATSASTAAGAGPSCAEALEAHSAAAAQQPEQHQSTRNWDDAGRCGCQWSALTEASGASSWSHHFGCAVTLSAYDLRLQQGD